MPTVHITNKTPYATTVSDPRGGFSVKVPANAEVSFTLTPAHLEAMAGVLVALDNKQFDGIDAYTIRVED